MALYLLKPVLWNTENYVRPSGVRASGQSFPGLNGYGHEEWNNSPKLRFVESKQRWCAFHTEGVKKAPVEEHAGQIFVFMTASHDRVQQLVGVAGNAMCLSAEDQLPERRRLAKLLKIDSFWSDAWRLPAVQRRFQNAGTFQQHFSADAAWIPNWICPEEFFLWLEKPVTLDSQRLTDKKALPMMFAGYQPISRETAALILNQVRTSQRTDTWARLLDALLSAPDSPMPLQGEQSDPATTRAALTQQRIGQGTFREALKQRWESACAVTGITCSELLRASHVRPWKNSNSRQRRDPENGLLLAAHMDALFDRGLMSFDSAGKMLLSSKLGSDVRQDFGLPRALRYPPSKQLEEYLEYHREFLFQK